MTLQAGKSVKLTSSSASAGGDMTIAGADVTIEGANNTSRSTATSESSFSGFSAGVSNGALSAGTTAVSKAQQAGAVKDQRLAALLAVEAARSDWFGEILTPKVAQQFSAEHSIDCGRHKFRGWHRTQPSP